MRAAALAILLLAAKGPAQEPARKVSAERALRWLAEEQDPGTGGWKGNDPGNKGPDAASTALAVLAFVGNGVSPWPDGKEDETFSENLRLGLSALVRMQGEDGSIGPKSRSSNEVAFHGTEHAHALATTALAEACRHTRREELLPAARKAVAYLEKRRVPGGGWGFAKGDLGTPQLTIFCLLALDSARKAGLEVDPKGEAEARSWLVSSIDPSDGTVKGLDPRLKRHGPPPVFCAAGVYLACHWAGTAEEDRAARTAIAFVGVKAPPRTREDDMLDLLFGALAMSSHGRETSRKWLEAAEALLAERQDGPELKRLEGSAEAFGPTSKTDGRVAGTAVLAITSGIAARSPHALGAP